MFGSTEVTPFLFFHKTRDGSGDADGTADCNDGCPDDANKTDPGECGCGVADTDSDGDGTVDCHDGCDGDPNKTEPGECGCGVVDDADADGVLSCGGDCDDGNGAVWSAPGEVQQLSLSQDAFSAETMLSWSAPVQRGGATVVYDTLRSSEPDGFGAATCVEPSDLSENEIKDASTPGVGLVYHYLVRAENDCPQGEGPLGVQSDGTPRAGSACP